MFYDLIGLAGVAAILLAYALLQFERVSYDGYGYLFLNGGGAALVMVSLLYAFNLAAFVLEGIWLTISIYGVLKRLRRDRVRAGG